MINYIGLTIGPIHKMLKQARKPRELWVSSYIFSYIMKKLIGKLRDQYSFYIPAMNDFAYLEKKHGVGIFHDRFICTSVDDEKTIDENLRTCINDVLEEIAAQMQLDFVKKPKPQATEKEIFTYLKNYFRLPFIIVAENSLTDTNNPIEQINYYLDCMELREPVAIYSKEDALKGDYLSEYFSNQILKTSFLQKDAFEDPVAVSCIEEIALGRNGELDKDSNEDEENPIMKAARRKKDFRKANAYVALVQADADNMRVVINRLWKDDSSVTSRIDKLNAFSNKIMEFSLAAADLVREFNEQAVPLYAGGDDLLFLSPVLVIEKDTKGAVVSTKTVFDLVDALHNEFNRIFAEYTKLDLPDDKKFSYSFGVKIFYYKDPLYEALDSVGSLLFEKAKRCKGKNTLAFQLTKHTGFEVEAILPKAEQGGLYALFKTMIKEYINQSDSKVSVVTSIVMTLESAKGILGYIIADKTKLENFFKNNFNENVHQEKSIQKLIDVVIEFIVLQYKVSKNEQENNRSELTNPPEEVALQQIYAIFRLLQFMTEKGAIL